MTTLREAAQQALEALQTVFMPFHPAVIDLKAALEQPERAPCQIAEDGVCESLECCGDPPRREWRGLTEDEKLQILDDTMEGGDLMDMARAIEQALKEKNHE